MAGPGVLFYANLGEGGSDGVLRSRDGGDRWEFLTAGMSDLRPAQQVVAQDADIAFASDRSGRLLAWRPATQRWEVILTPANAYTPLGSRWRRMAVSCCSPTTTGNAVPTVVGRGST
ncbi:MAG: hypothetical protein HZY76_01965 [Anaerolineae bacterium]|nr:MAG: hypothetical protein HZY76_01965 [Anaerolineae bacterium]